MSYFPCRKCGKMVGVIGTTIYSCGCKPDILTAEQMKAKQDNCPHINGAGHEWQSWCLDCGKTWPNNLHNRSVTIATCLAK